jgi:hypothetical protein
MVVGALAKVEVRNFPARTAAPRTGPDAIASHNDLPANVTVAVDRAALCLGKRRREAPAQG